MNIKYHTFHNCEFTLVGSQVFRTRTINNNLNPVFNECFEAVVDQASGQKLRIEVFERFIFFCRHFYYFKW
jgi:Ca2+-dependent lipid-binding protein